MANNAQNTNISYDAKLYYLPEGVALPTTWNEELEAGAVDLGYLDEGGEAFSQTNSTEQLRAHQNRDVVRTIVTDGTVTLAPTLLEDKAAVRELFHGSVAEDGVITIDANQTITGNFVYDTLDTQVGFEKAIRFVGRANVTPNGDITFAPGALVTYPILLTYTGKVLRMDQPETPVLP